MLCSSQRLLRPFAGSGLLLAMMMLALLSNFALRVQALVITVPAAGANATVGTNLLVTFDTQGFTFQSVTVTIQGQYFCSVNAPAIDGLASCQGIVPCGLEANPALVVTGLLAQSGVKVTAPPVEVVFVDNPALCVAPVFSSPVTGSTYNALDTVEATFNYGFNASNVVVTVAGYVLCTIPQVTAFVEASCTGSIPCAAIGPLDSVGIAGQNADGSAISAAVPTVSLTVLSTSACNPVLGVCGCPSPPKDNVTPFQIVQFILSLAESDDVSRYRNFTLIAINSLFTESGGQEIFWETSGSPLSIRSECGRNSWLLLSYLIPCSWNDIGQTQIDLQYQVFFTESLGVDNGVISMQMNVVDNINCNVVIYPFPISRPLYYGAPACNPRPAIEAAMTAVKRAAKLNKYPYEENAVQGNVETLMQNPALLIAEYDMYESTMGTSLQGSHMAKIGVARENELLARSNQMTQSVQSVPRRYKYILDSPKGILTLALMAPAAFYASMRDLSLLASALSTSFIQAPEASEKVIRAMIRLALAAPARTWNGIMTIRRAAKALYAIKDLLKQFCAMPYFATLIRKAFDQDPQALAAFLAIDKQTPFIGQIKGLLVEGSLKRAFRELALVLTQAPRSHLVIILKRAPNLWRLFLFIAKQDSAAAEVASTGIFDDPYILQMFNFVSAMATEAPSELLLLLPSILEYLGNEEVRGAKTSIEVMDAASALQKDATAFTQSPAAQSTIEDAINSLPRLLALMLSGAGGKVRVFIERVACDLRRRLVKALVAFMLDSRCEKRYLALLAVLQEYFDQRESVFAMQVLAPFMRVAVVSQANYSAVATKTTASTSTPEPALETVLNTPSYDAAAAVAALGKTRPIQLAKLAQATLNQYLAVQQMFRQAPMEFAKAARSLGKLTAAAPIASSLLYTQLVPVFTMLKDLASNPVTAPDTLEISAQAPLFMSQYVLQTPQAASAYYAIKAAAPLETQQLVVSFTSFVASAGTGSPQYLGAAAASLASLFKQAPLEMSAFLEHFPAVMDTVALAAASPTTFHEPASSQRLRQLAPNVYPALLASLTTLMRTVSGIFVQAPIHAPTAVQTSGEAIAAAPAPAQTFLVQIPNSQAAVFSLQAAASEATSLLAVNSSKELLKERRYKKRKPKAATLATIMQLGALAQLEPGSIAAVADPSKAFGARAALGMAIAPISNVPVSFEYAVYQQTISAYGAGELSASETSQILAMAADGNAVAVSLIASYLKDPAQNVILEQPALAALAVEPLTVAQSSALYSAFSLQFPLDEVNESIDVQALSRPLTLSSLQPFDTLAYVVHVGGAVGMTYTNLSITLQSVNCPEKSVLIWQQSGALDWSGNCDNLVFLAVGEISRIFNCAGRVEVLLAYTAISANGRREQKVSRKTVFIGANPWLVSKEECKCFSK